MEIKTNGFKLPSGDIHVFIPPEPTETDRGGIKASEKTTESLEVKYDKKTGKLFSPTSPTDNTLTKSNVAADAKKTGDEFARVNNNMESKLDKQQGVENAGKAMVINPEGVIVPGEVTGGDGIPIINTMSGESPLVISDSAERINKGFSIIGNTVQNQDPPPSPDNPQEIKNVGKWNPETQKYEVDIRITNAKESWDKEQTLTLTSDRPITKWDKLVEKDGEIGWLYGSKRYKVTGNESFESRGGYNGDSYTNRFFILNDMQTDKIYSKPIGYVETLNHVLYCYASNVNKEGFDTNINQFHIKLSNDRVGILISDDHAVRTAKFSEYMKKIHENGNPIEILYATTDTVFLPLPQPEQDSIRALATYYPTTVITVDGGEVDPDIEVTYTADTKNYIDQKIAPVIKSVVDTQKALL